MNEKLWHIEHHWSTAKATGSDNYYIFSPQEPTKKEVIEALNLSFAPSGTVLINEVSFTKFRPKIQCPFCRHQFHMEGYSCTNQ